MPDISEENHISIPINLLGTTILAARSINDIIEAVVIKDPSETRASSESTVINGETYNYYESNVKKDVARIVEGEGVDKIVID